MALLGSFIDVRTIASIDSNASASFAHGLPAAPDFVIIMGTSNASGVSSNAMALPRYAADATNVSLFGVGLASGPTKVSSVVAHSIIR
jgi:hypothetical protein